MRRILIAGWLQDVVDQPGVHYWWQGLLLMMQVCPYGALMVCVLMNNASRSHSAGHQAIRRF